MSYYIDISKYDYDSMQEVYKWCEQHVEWHDWTFKTYLESNSIFEPKQIISGHNWYFMGKKHNGIVFTNEEDAIAFKLRFGI